MQNISIDRKGNQLVITVDLSRDLGPSKSGKTTLIASTQGNATVAGPEGIKVGVNVYKSR